MKKENSIMDMALNDMEYLFNTFPARKACSSAHFCKIAKDLDEREHLILMNRVLGTMTLSDIAAVMGVTTERVRKIEAKLKIKLRTRLYDSEGRSGCVCHFFLAQNGGSYASSNKGLCISF